MSLEALLYNDKNICFHIYKEKEFFLGEHIDLVYLPIPSKHQSKKQKLWLCSKLLGYQ